MKPCSEMLLEVTVYCGKVRDQRGPDFRSFDPPEPGTPASRRRKARAAKAGFGGKRPVRGTGKCATRTTIGPPTTLWNRS